MASAPAPERGEVEPGAIRHILADTFILEIEEQETRFPVGWNAGSAHFFGHELRGAGPSSSLWDPQTSGGIRSVRSRSSPTRPPASYPEWWDTPTGEIRSTWSSSCCRCATADARALASLGALSPAMIPPLDRLRQARPYKPGLDARDLARRAYADRSNSPATTIPSNGAGASSCIRRGRILRCGDMQSVIFFAIRSCETAGLSTR